MELSGKEWGKKLTIRLVWKTVPRFLIMFLGEFHHTLDDKGRLSVPSGYRVALSKGAVVTRGLDRTLFLYPKEQWRSLAGKIAALPFSQADTRAFARLMLAGAIEVKLDKSGRIVIPEYLRIYANLSKKVVISGLYDRLEIWNEVSWNDYVKKAEKNSNDIAERLGPLGL